MILKTILTLIYFQVLYIFTFIEIWDVYNQNWNSILFIFFTLNLVISISGLIFLRKYNTKNIDIKNEIIYTFKSIFFLYLFLIIWFFISQEYLTQNRLMLTETKLSWNLSFLFLVLGLLVSPILTFVKNIKIRDFLVLFRKIFGILVFIIFLRHIVNFFQSHYPNWEVFLDYFNYFIWVVFESPVLWSGTIWWVMLILLGITSNKFSVKKIWWKLWKILHLLVFPAFLFTMLHIYYLWRLDWFYWWFTWLIILARIIATISRRHKRKKKWKITKYICIPCGFIYDERLWDPDSGLEPWTKFEDIPEDWYCPVCWVGKNDFEPYFEAEDSIFWWYLLKVIKNDMLTGNVLHLVLQWDKHIDCLPWQYAWLVMKDFDWEFTRSFSIVSNKDNNLEFYIKLKHDWRAWKLLKNTNIWDYFKISGVYWRFVLQETANQKVFIATWTWFAPIISMISQNTFSKNNILFFWVAKKQDIFWVDWLNKFDNLEVNIFFSKEKVEWYNYWRINLENINSSQNTEFYICWNPNMVEQNIKLLEKKWYKNIFYEKFK